MKHIICFVFIFICFSCGVDQNKKMEKMLVGKWIATEISGKPAPDDGDYWLFRDNGTMIERIFGREYMRFYMVENDVLKLGNSSKTFVTDMKILNFEPDKIHLKFLGIEKKMNKISYEE